VPATDAPGWLTNAVSDFGIACAEKLAGPGEREAAIRSPIEALLRTVGVQLGLHAVFHDEVRDVDRRVRPDYGVSIGGAISGYVEVKAPGRGIDPARFSGHDLEQWERQKDLPNLLYTNGVEWRLFRGGEQVHLPVSLEGGSLDEAGAGLLADVALEQILTDFLRWQPAPITSVGALIRAIAPLTRLLRGEVMDQLASERLALASGASEDDQPFHGLAADWRALLFPQADDATFADGYAQAVTFGLLLARTEGIDLGGRELHQIGAELGAEHSLMGKALQLLTGDVAADFKVTLDLLVRVVGAVDWRRIRRGRRDTYLHLYEDFLELYDNELRKRSGSYYTPHAVVDEMVRLTEEVLVGRLGRTKAFRDPNVVIIDPAMGTGTYLQTILERSAEATAADEGPGAVPGVLSQVAERLIGFEIQMGPYAVAELRAADLLASYGASTPEGGMKLFVTDTLDDPYAEVTQLGSTLQLIARARRQANRIKASSRVTVVVGNPPYKELAAGLGGWVEHGGADAAGNEHPILEDFYGAGTERFRAKLKNLYVFFWRWATWKVWESTPQDPEGDVGVVCFISTAGYLTSPAFAGMREYLRKNASEGWVIDLTPEGHTPDVPTRVFPGVRQPLAIGLFVRQPDVEEGSPAKVWYRSIAGRQKDKFERLSEVRLDDDGWRLAREAWASPLTPAADSDWDTFPAVSDLFPWYSPGVFPTRTWVYAPAIETLRRRWARLVGAAQDEKASLFKEGSEPRINRRFEALPGSDVSGRTQSVASDRDPTLPAAVRVAFRAFDRQWLIADNRVIHRSRANLWAARRSGQLFIGEQHREPIGDGPALIFSALIPDFHHFNGRGGRTMPLLHPDGSANLAPGLLEALRSHLGCPVSVPDLVCYIAGLVSHSAFTRTFSDELHTPGVRVPMTGDPERWQEVVELGQRVLRLQTFGEVVMGKGPAQDDVRYPIGDERRVLARAPIAQMPAGMQHDAEQEVLRIGTGEFGPVPLEVFEYVVGGRNVLKSWFDYRKAEPGGRRSTPLDDVHVDRWDPDWTTELVELLSVLRQLVDLEDEQADALSRLLDGPLLSASDLAAGGARWPQSNADRVPRYAVVDVVDAEGTLDLG
jgi:hypothetical protein